MNTGQTIGWVAVLGVSALAVYLVWKSTEPDGEFVLEFAESETDEYYASDTYAEVDDGHRETLALMAGVKLGAGPHELKLFRKDSETQEFQMMFQYTFTIQLHTRTRLNYSWTSGESDETLEPIVPEA